MPIDLAQFHETFYEESFEAIAAMEQVLLRLDGGERNPDLIHTLFRAAHSIKGGAATFGFQAISSFTHSLEALLDEVRGGRLQLTQSLVQLLLRAVDVLRGMLSAQRARLSINPQQVVDLQFEMERASAQQRSTPLARSDIKAATEALSGVAARASADGRSQALTTADATPDTRASAEGALRCYDISVRPLPRLFTRRNDPLRLFRGLEALGELQVHADITALPPVQEFDPENCYLSWSLQLRTTVTREAILEVFEWTQGDCALDVTAIEEAVPTSSEESSGDALPSKPIPIEREHPQLMTSVQPLLAPAAGRSHGDERSVAPEFAAPMHSADSNSLRVGVAKIDQLMNAVSELAVTQSMLAQLGASLAGTAGERLRAGLEQLERHVRDLQEQVMRVRMVPIGVVFNRFPRVVRDLSQRLGKQVELKVSGSDTELDKSVLEKIGDPLTHLVRNCVDHGIELPERRRASGKAVRGTVELHASHRGSSVRVEIRDDGAGLDRERILAKARERGVVAASELLSDAAICELIFVAGLTTSEQATLVSGRGVGMDVVKSNIEALGGRIELQSRQGHGTRFIITLPLTLAIVDGQTVAVGAESYIVPLAAIVESIPMRTASIKQLPGRGEVLGFRGDYVPVLRLAQLFGAAQPRVREALSEIVMVVEADGRRVGLIVDALIGQQQVVVKTLEANYGQVEGIAGATVLGDGSVALILDVERLIHSLAGRLAA